MIREILNIDCMEYLKSCDDNQFDLCVTSPPYNMNLRVRSSTNRTEKVRACCSRKIVKEISTKYNNYSDNLDMDEYLDFINSIVGELLRTCTTTFFNIQVITGNKPAVFKMLGKYAENIKELIIWDKCHGQPAIGERILNSRYELIIVFSNASLTRQFNQAYFDRGTLDNLWQIRRDKSDNKLHGATFPKLLTDTILSNFAQKGDRVFDPFLGTGTTAVSAHYAGCDFTGCEIDKSYYDFAVNRINIDTAQKDLFNN